MKILGCVIIVSLVAMIAIPVLGIEVTGEMSVVMMIFVFLIFFLTALILIFGPLISFKDSLSEAPLLLLNPFTIGGIAILILVLALVGFDQPLTWFEKILSLIRSIIP